MPTVCVTFYKLIQDSQNFGSDDDHMCSRVFGSLAVDAENIGHFHVDLKQAVGGDIRKGEIEVGPPIGYNGPLDHHKVSDAARKYFSMLVGSQGSAIQLGPNAQNIRMQGNVVFQSETFNLYPARS